MQIFKMKKPNRRSIFVRAAAGLLSLCLAVGGISENAFAFGGQDPDSFAYSPDSGIGTTVEDSYVLEVCTGVSDGSHVEYFMIEYTDKDNVKRSEYVFPHGDLTTSCFTKRSESGYAVKSFPDMIQDSADRKREVESNMSGISLPDFKSNPGGGLATSQTDTYLFTLPYAMKSLEDIKLFLAGKNAAYANAGSSSGWDCTGVRLYKAEKLYGRQMAGFYSTSSYWDFDGTLIAQTVFSQGYGIHLSSGSTGKTFSLSNTAGCTLEKNISRDYKSSEVNRELLFRIDLADIYGGGLEALVTDLYLLEGKTVPMDSNVVTFDDIASLKLVEAMALDVYYLDIYGNERLISMPVISSYIGWLAQNYRSIKDAKLAGVAQQGDTLVFDAAMPQFAEITAFRLCVGSKAIANTRITETYDDSISKDRQQKLQKETASVLAVSVYDPDDAGVQVSAAMDGNLVYCSVKGMPFYAYVSGSADGMLINSNSTVKLEGRPVENPDGSVGMLVLPSMDNDTYIVELCTDTVTGADTNEEIKISLNYVDTNGKEHSTEEYVISDKTGEFYGCWPAKDGSGNAVSYPYLQGTSRSGRLQFMVHINDVDHFTGASIFVPEKKADIDDWQMSFLNIYAGSGCGRRHVTMLPSVNEISQAYTKQNITRSILKSSRLISYNKKVYLNQNQRRIDISFDANSSQEADTEPYNWEEISREMDFNETKLDFGFTAAKYTYNIMVDVASNVGELASSSEYGDCGSVNQYYFQLVFENGKSGYVLANQQLTADGFRAGEQENFTIYTNRNYGSLVAIHILPDDTIDEENIYDKLCISAITVEEVSTNAVNRTWVFRDLGWVDINFVDNGAQSTAKGQMARYESDMISSYLTDEETYRMNLMIAVSTGMYDEGKFFNGSLSAYLTYEKPDGTRVNSGVFDVGQRMALYANNTADSMEVYDGFKLIDPSYMLCANHTSRFMVSIENAHRLQSITFIAHGKGTFTWPIKEVDVYQVAGGGTLYLNSSGEYQQSGDVEFLCRSAETAVTKLSVMYGNTADTSLNFTDNLITLDPENLELSIKRSPDIGTDKVNVMVFPRRGSNVHAAELASLKLYFRKWDEQYEEKTLNGFWADEGGLFAYAKDVDVAGMTSLDSLTVLGPDDLHLDHIVVQHIRDNVIVDTFRFAFNPEVPAVSAGEVTPEAGSKTQKLVLTLRMDGSTVHTQLVPEKDDIAVAVAYVPENSVDGGTYRSEVVFLSDFGYTEIDPGDIYQFTLEVEGAQDILGYIIAKVGAAEGAVDGAVLTRYDKKIQGDTEGWEFSGEYYFDEQLNLGREMKMVPVTDTPLTLLTVDMEVETDILKNYAVEQLAMDIVYNDSEGEQKLEIENLEDYLSGDSLLTGGRGSVNVFIPDLQSLRYISLRPLNDDPEVIAQWGLRTVDISKTAEGETTQLAHAECDKTVYENQGYSVNLQPLSMYLEAKSEMLDGKEAFEPIRIDLGAAEPVQIDIDFRQKLSFSVNIQNGLPDSGYSVSVEKLDYLTGEYVPVEKPLDYILRMDKETCLFNPPVNIGAANYRLTFAADERPDEPIVVQVTCNDTVDIVYYLCEIEFTETTKETLLDAEGSDIYIAFTYLPEEGSAASELRMSPYYRLSSLLGNIRSGAKFVLPEAVESGKLPQTVVVMAHTTEDDDEKAAEAMEVGIKQIRLYEVDQNKGYIVKTPFIVSENKSEQRFVKEGADPVNTHELSARNYVSSGLIAQFDGIENYAYGKHIDDADYWNDLTGRYKAMFNNYTDGCWDEDGLLMDRSLYAQFDAVLPENCTIEIVCDAPITTGSAKYQALFMADDESASVYRSGTSLYFRHHDNATSSCPSIKGYNGSSVVAMYTGKTGALGYAGLSGMMTVIGSNAGGSQNKTWYIGGNSSYYALSGKIYAIRIYNRVLSEEDLIQNYLYDQIRFFGMSLEDALYDLNEVYKESQDQTKDYFLWEVSGTPERGLKAMKITVKVEEPTEPEPSTEAEPSTEESTPEETTPAETEPEETTPAETTPAETIPEETIPAETTPEETTPAETTAGEPTAEASTEGSAAAETEASPEATD